jgi:membrane-associated phospholipid phosphatase
MHNRTKFLAIIFILFALCFLWLSMYVVANPIPEIDQKISLFIQKHPSDFLDKVMLEISFFGELPYSLLMVVIVSIIFFLYKLRREAYFISSILLSGVLILVIKNLINRPRPTQFYVRLVEINRFNSFPSGHVLSYILFFGFMIVLMHTQKRIPKRVKHTVTIISLFYMVTIAFSRIYLGAHWFTDTLGGFLLGICCLIVLSYFYLRKLESYSKASSKSLKVKDRKSNISKQENLKSQK